MEAAPRQLACPNCGASVRFRWAQAVQTTCEFCKSVVVRTDLDLALIGKQAEFPATGSPIQLGTEGTWRGERFVVVGRLTYAYERGRWNEWHARTTNGGASVWLSDAQLAYAMTRAVAVPDSTVPAPKRAVVGASVGFDGQLFTVSSRTMAQYVGTEGELPFSTHGLLLQRESLLFVDLESSGSAFATIDYSDETPVVYVGEFVAFDDLGLTQLREFAGWSR
jgi:hypothetical protein